jgi:hypothetical protein
MQIRISSELAAKLDFPKNSLLVRACFYIGMGTTETLETVKGGILYQKEKESIIASALDLGMNEADEITVIVS